MMHWTFQFSVVAKAAQPEHVWPFYADTSRWLEWDHELSDVKLEGPFAAGTKGALKPKDGPRTRFVLSAVEPLKGFSDTSFLPLASMDFEHKLEPVAEGTRLTHIVTIRGPLTFVWRRVIGRKIAAQLPTAMQTLAQLATQAALNEKPK
jgi:hypothetical protein